MDFNRLWVLIVSLLSFQIQPPPLNFDGFHFFFFFILIIYSTIHYNVMFILPPPFRHTTLPWPSLQPNRHHYHHHRHHRHFHEHHSIATATSMPNHLDYYHLTMTVTIVPFSPPYHNLLRLPFYYHHHPYYDHHWYHLYRDHHLYHHHHYTITTAPTLLHHPNPPLFPPVWLP